MSTNNQTVSNTTGKTNKEAEKQRMHSDASGELRAWLASQPLTANDPQASLRYIHDFVQAAALLDLYGGGCYCDFGAGSGWIGEWLARLGFRTITVDISFDMMSIARQRCMDTGLDVAHVVADGEALPFRAAAFDGLICVNAFHHLPDMPQALREMNRVLKETGSAVLFEPGEGHSDDPRSQRDMEDLGVLEQDVTIEALSLMAGPAGFRRVETGLYTFPVSTLNVDEWPPFKADYLGGTTLRHRRPDLLSACADHMRRHPLFRLSRLPFAHSRQPGILACTLNVLHRDIETGPSGRFRVDVRVKNTGNTLWLADAVSGLGMVRLGAHLQGDDGMLIDFEFARVSLDSDLRPGQEALMSLIAEAPTMPGRYRLQLDMVSEGIVWFAQRGSPTVSIPLIVGTLDVSRSSLRSDVPGRLEARIDRISEFPERAAIGMVVQCFVTVTNVGDTIWIAAASGEPGAVSVAVHIRHDEEDESVIYDAGRLYRDVSPGESVVFMMTLSLPRRAGTCHIMPDVMWENRRSLLMQLPELTIVIENCLPKRKLTAFPADASREPSACRRHFQKADWYEKAGRLREAREEWTLAHFHASHVALFRERQEALTIAIGDDTLPRILQALPPMPAIEDFPPEISLLFENVVELRGFRCENSPREAGTIVQCELLWSTGRPLLQNITAWLHCYHETVVTTSMRARIHARRFAGIPRTFFQHDFMPGGQDWPSSFWVPESLVRSSILLAIPADCRPGKYTIMLGLWIAGNPRTLFKSSTGCSYGERIGSLEITSPPHGHQNDRRQGQQA